MITSYLRLYFYHSGKIGGRFRFHWNKKQMTSIGEFEVSYRILMELDFRYIGIWSTAKHKHAYAAML